MLFFLGWGFVARSKSAISSLEGDAASLRPRRVKLLGKHLRKKSSRAGRATRAANNGSCSKPCFLLISTAVNNGWHYWFVMFSAILASDE